MARKEINSEPDAAALAEINDEPSHEVTVHGSGGIQLGAITGEVDPGQIRLPRLQITYGVGTLAENFHPGDLVLGGDNLLVPKETPLYLIALGAHQFWKEYLSKEQYAAKVRPLTFSTAAEVKANGGTTDWVKRPDGTSQGPTFSLAMDVKMLIRKPTDLVCGLFGVPIGDHEYAPAIWSLDKTAYKRVGPVILQMQSFSLRQRGLYSGLLELQTAMEKVNGNVTPTPKLKLHGHLSDLEVQQLQELFPKVNSAVAAD